MEEQINETKRTSIYIYYQGEYVLVTPYVYDGEEWNEA